MFEKKLPKIYSRVLELVMIDGGIKCYEICVIGKFKLRYFLPPGRLIWSNSPKTKREIFYGLAREKFGISHSDISMNPYEASKLEEAIEFFSNEKSDSKDLEKIKENLNILFETIGIQMEDEK